jgi:hypothetical protein
MGSEKVSMLGTERNKNMAKREQLDLLKRGVKEWNQWRDTNPYTRPDLSDADLRAARLSGAYLYQVNLNGARLSGARLSNADLRRCHLREANLSGADLKEANLGGADLSGADLSGASLREANLREADLSRTDLREANLSRADLRKTNLSGTNLSGTVFGGIDLREACGLETVHHRSPSSIPIETIYRSAGQIPEAFLRGTGVPETFIEYLHSLVIKPIDYFACFIRYSRQDEAFAHRLFADLCQKRVRCWLAPDQMKMGDKLGHCSDEAIHFADKLLLVLSEHSIRSPWVHQEVEVVLEKEQQRGRQILVPLVLDDAIYHTVQTWAVTLRRRKQINNFIKWEQDDDYQRAFERLLRDLKEEA